MHKRRGPDGAKAEDAVERRHDAAPMPPVELADMGGESPALTCLAMPPVREIARSPTLTAVSFEAATLAS